MLGLPAAGMAFSATGTRMSLCRGRADTLCPPLDDRIVPRGDLPEASQFRRKTLTKKSISHALLLRSQMSAAVVVQLYKLRAKVERAHGTRHLTGEAQAVTAPPRGVRDGDRLQQAPAAVVAGGPDKIGSGSGRE